MNTTSSQNRRKSSVVFYQADEESEARNPSEIIKEESCVRRTDNRPQCLKLKMPSKSLESEDSGVKCNEEEEVFRPPTARKKSRVSIHSLPSSPAFELSTFDELFQTGGVARLYLHRVPTFIRQPSFRRKSTIDSPLEEFSEPETDTSKDPPNNESRPQLKRQDTIMSQSLKSLIYTSWQSTKGFYEYRQRIGNAVHHKYCMCCRIESTLFVFLYVVYGIFLTCAGVMCTIDCSQELLLSAYLITDGLLSVFVFPILVLDWSKRIGGCINDREDVGSDVFWIGTLLLRAIFAGIGTSIVFYLNSDRQSWENSLCYVEFCVLISSVVFEWSFLLFVILVPLCICGVTFIFAPSWGSYYDL